MGYCLLIRIPRTFVFEGGLLIGILRAIDLGCRLVIGTTSTVDLEGGLLVGIIRTIDLGYCLFGIAHTID